MSSSSSSLTTLTSPSELQELLKEQNNSKVVLLWTASWHEEGCAPLVHLLTTLSSVNVNKNDNVVVFATMDAEDCEEVAESYQVESIPTVLCIAAGGTVVERLQGTSALEASHLTRTVQGFVSSTPIIATTTTTTGTATTSGVVVIDPNASSAAALKQRLDGLVRKDHVMLFMKGNASAPKCGFSRQAVELLAEQQVPYSSFDILQDDEVRQGLKTQFEWPTFPQIYVKGALQGGLDVMKEMIEEGPSLTEQWGLTNDNSENAATAVSSSSPLQDRLHALVRRSPIMVFMKGLPSNPQCGFSRQLIELLDSFPELSYDAFDIYQDEDVRQGLKEYSQWPTYPQVYVGGELIGGLDIVQELHQDHELETLLLAAAGNK